MAFKIIEKRMGCAGMEDDEISINSYGVTFGTNVSNLLNGFDYVEVYFDQELSRVGFKPSVNRVNGFKIGTSNTKDGRKTISGSWALRLPNNRFKAVQDGEFIVVENCEITDKPQKIKI